MPDTILRRSYVPYLSGGETVGPIECGSDIETILGFNQDIILQCKDGRCGGIRVVLAISSRFLAAILAGQLASPGQCGVVLILPSATVHQIKLLHTFLIFGRIEASRENDLLAIMNLLKVDIFDRDDITLASHSDQDALASHRQNHGSVQPSHTGIVDELLAMSPEEFIEQFNPYKLTTVDSDGDSDLGMEIRDICSITPEMCSDYSPPFSLAEANLDPEVNGCDEAKAAASFSILDLTKDKEEDLNLSELKINGPPAAGQFTSVHCQKKIEVEKLTFCCEFCGKSFTSPEFFAEHLNQQEEEKEERKEEVEECNSSSAGVLRCPVGDCGYSQSVDSYRCRAHCVKVLSGHIAASHLVQSGHIAASHLVQSGHIAASHLPRVSSCYHVELASSSYPEEKLSSSSYPEEKESHSGLKYQENSIFRRPDNQETHSKLTPDNNQKHKCFLCDKWFFSRNNLLIHREKRHSWRLTKNRPAPAASAASHPKPPAYSAVGSSHSSSLPAVVSSSPPPPPTPSAAPVSSPPTPPPPTPSAAPVSSPPTPQPPTESTLKWCIPCQSIFVSGVAYQAHLAESHPETRPKASQLRCEECSRVFVQNKAYIRHLLRHSCRRGTQVCPVCSRSFCTAAALKSHNTRMHLKQSK